MSHERALTMAAKEPAVDVDFSGTWKNQLNSTMTISVDGNQISGRYRSEVSGEDRPIEGDITGWVNGDLISVTVNWPSAAITAWVGQMTKESGRNIIHTLWQMTMNVPDDQEKDHLWLSVLAGADQFHR